MCSMKGVMVMMFSRLRNRVMVMNTGSILYVFQLPFIAPRIKPRMSLHNTRADDTSSTSAEGRRMSQDWTLAYRNLIILQQFKAQNVTAIVSIYVVSIGCFTGFESSNWLRLSTC